MQHVKLCLLGVALTVSISWSASAVTILIGYYLITPDTQEDFQSRQVENIEPVFGFNGFTYQETGRSRITADVCDPFDGGDQCLSYSDSGEPMRFFDLNGSAFGFEVSSSSDLSVEVRGNSGTASFDISSGLFGVYDALGLIDITVTRLTTFGDCNSCNVTLDPTRPPDRNPNEAVVWGDSLFIDDVITQSSPVLAVSEPTTLMSSLAGFIALLAVRCKQKKRNGGNYRHAAKKGENHG